ncbi:MAG: hypothetical protein ABW061_09415 [Polyangiaceae bacterium]
MHSLQLTAWLSASALLLLACGSSSEADHGAAGASNTSEAGTTATAGSTADAAAGMANGGARNGTSGSANGAGASSIAGNTAAGAASGGTSAGGAGAGASGAGTSAGGASGAGTAGAAIGGAAGASGSGGGSSVVFPPNCKCLNLGPPSCTPTGHVTYTLARAAAPTDDQKTAYDLITCAMDGAVAYYNCNTTITKQLNVTYNPDVPTADGNYNGSVRFGGHEYMECATGMHEIAHAVGVGTAPKWSTYSVGGVFTGTTAIAQLRTITGNAEDVLHSDTQHFWPYGLNYASEAKSTADLVDHCLMVTAIRKDLGL